MNASLARHALRLPRPGSMMVHRQTVGGSRGEDDPDTRYLTLLEYKEWIMMSMSLLTSAWNVNFSAPSFGLNTLDASSLHEIYMHQLLTVRFGTI